MLRYSPSFSINPLRRWDNLWITWDETSSELSLAIMWGNFTHFCKCSRVMAPVREVMVEDFKVILYYGDLQGNYGSFVVFTIS